MPTLKVHYEGWIALPSGLRQQLGLSSGDRLEAQLIDGAIVLRPASRARVPKELETTSEPPAAKMATADAPAKRKPGRPRKLTATDAPLPAAKRPRGRPRKTALASELAPAAPVPVPASSEHWKLRKKSELQPAASGPDQSARPARPAVSARRDSGYQLEERRPFRNVEVRKLGPGQRHNRLQRAMNTTGAG